MSRKDIIESMYPLAPLQEAMLYHVLSGSEVDVYLQQQRFRLRGKVDVAVLKNAWQWVFDRHASLRTALVWDRGDEPFQVVCRGLKVPFEEHDWRGLGGPEQRRRRRRFFVDNEKRGIDLRKPPAMRLDLLRYEDELCELVWTYHHVHLDAWSVAVVLEELAVCYEAMAHGKEPELAPPQPFQNYVKWVRSQDTAEAERTWRGLLEGFDEPTPLPFDLGAPERDEQIEHGIAVGRVPAETSAGLESLARRHKVTVGTLVHGAWALLLSRLSGRRDVVFGMTTAGRPAELEGAESMVGLFINVLPFRLRVDPRESFLAWLDRLQRTQLEIRQLEYCSLAKIRDWSGAAPGKPLFESGIVFQNAPSDPETGGPSGGLEVEMIGSYEEKRQAPLLLEVAPGPELSLNLGYHAPRFDEDAARRIMDSFSALLAGMAAAPDSRLGELPLLSAERRAEIVAAIDAGRRDWSAGCVHELFEEQVERRPDEPALACDGGQTLSYRELERQANALAHHLLALGAGPEDRVGIYLERGPEMMISLLAILKAGAAYVPLDTSQPVKRLAALGREAGLRLAVTCQDLARAWPDRDLSLVLLDTDRSAIAGRSAKSPNRRARPENLAYLLFTSGTSGTPKAVAVEHRQVVNYVRGLEERLELEGPASFATVTTPAADLGNTSIFGAWCRGGCLRVVSSERVADPQALAADLGEHPVDCLKIVPSLWNVLRTVPGAERGLPRKRLILGGEALDRKDVRGVTELAPTCRVFNHYGPTESTIGSLVYEVESGEPSGPVPLGRALPNLRAWLLDERAQPVPEGGVGEIFLGGAGLARGYHGRAALTAERFFPDEHSDDPGARLYRTGDRARQTSGGDFVFLGRRDQQVKIRGFRVELEEVAAQLRDHPAVEKALVLPFAGGAGETTPAAFVVARRARRPVLEGEARVRLPNGMAIVERNRRETEVLYRDIFEHQSYFRHGIGLTEAPCVLDVGANIGLFSLLVSQLRPRARILAFEPVEPIYSALCLNTELYGPNVECLPYGLSSREGAGEFVYYPEYSAMSGVAAFADVEREIEVVKRFLNADPGEDVADQEGIAAELDQVLADRFRAEHRECRLRRLSDVLSEREIGRVDLLKIDVQRAEMDVVSGIDDADWEKIDQIVAEVHDLSDAEGSRLERIRELLGARGFDVELEQEEILRGTELFTVYARRRELGAPPAAEAPFPIAETDRPAPLSAAELEAHLAERLPDYMVPTSFTILETLPVTANGKVDREALLAGLATDLSNPEAALDGAPASGVAAPRSPLEEELAAIWREVLGIEEIDIHRTFFEQGGHSLLVMKMMIRLRKDFGVHIPLQSFMMKPTLADLAVLVVQELAEGVDEGEMGRMLANV